MKLERSTWISIAAAVLVCAATILWQRNTISAMNDSVDDLQLKLDTAAPTAGSPASTSILPSAIRSKVEPSITSKTKRLSLEEIVSQLPAEAIDQRASFRMMPRLLESFADYSVDELFAAFQELESLAEKDPDRSNALGFLHSTLLMVVAEAAPARLLQLADEQDDHMLRTVAYSGLLRKDLAGARDVLAAADWSQPEIRMAKSSLMAELVKQDLPAALEFMRENESDFHFFSGSVVGIATDDESVRGALWDSLPSEPSEIVQSELTQGLVLGAYMSEGLAGARRAMERADYLNDEVRLSILYEVAGESMRSDADATYEWIRESLPAEQVGDALTQAVREWTRKDFNAAGTWLGAQESSPERDRAIGAFAATVVNLDPTAAASWANAIEDQSFRRTTLDSILGVWGSADSAAMDAWAEENGVDTGGVPRAMPELEE